nr:PREDICTED: uncharacterized protein LOC102687750 isoform X2 [Lepisosteus oculatus]
MKMLVLCLLLLSPHLSSSTYFNGMSSDSSNSDESGQTSLTYRLPAYYRYRQSAQVPWMKTSKTIKGSKSTANRDNPVATIQPLPASTPVTPAVRTVATTTQKRGGSTTDLSREQRISTPAPDYRFEENNFLDGEMVTQNPENDEVREFEDGNILDGYPVTQRMTTVCVKPRDGNEELKEQRVTSVKLNQGPHLIPTTLKNTLTPLMPKDMNDSVDLQEGPVLENPNSVLTQTTVEQNQRRLSRTSQSDLEVTTKSHPSTDTTVGKQHDFPSKGPERHLVTQIPTKRTLEVRGDSYVEMDSLRSPSPENNLMGLIKEGYLGNAKKNRKAREVTTRKSATISKLDSPTWDASTAEDMTDRAEFKGPRRKKKALKDGSVETGLFLLRHKRASRALKPDSSKKDVLNRNGDIIDMLKTAESMELVKIKMDQDVKMETHRPEYDIGGDSWEQFFNENNDYQVEEYIHPCESYHCPRGKMCKLNNENKPKCVCQDPSTCPPAGISDHVCGTDNKTYDSACHLFTAKCLYGGNLHLDYNGQCKYISPCLDSELTEFSHHIHGWLKDVMVHLYEYDLRNPGYLSKKHRIIVKKIYDLHGELKAGGKQFSRRRRNFEINYLVNVYPVHWQFGQLDQRPADGYLSHSELAPLRAPLVPMEHCTSRFFKQCDSNRDRRVSLKEWCSCFGIKNDVGSDLHF